MSDIFLFISVNGIQEALENKKDLTIPILFNIHAGHVDPQTIVPLGGECVMKFEEGKTELYFNYGSHLSWEDFYMKNWSS